MTNSLAVITLRDGGAGRSLPPLSPAFIPGRIQKMANLANLANLSQVRGFFPPQESPPGLKKKPPRPTRRLSGRRKAEGPATGQPTAHQGARLASHPRIPSPGIASVAHWLCCCRAYTERIRAGSRLGSSIAFARQQAQQRSHNDERPAQRLRPAT